MSRERLYLFDTTLRDGAQTNGVDFTLADKLAIARMLDELGVDYVEAGYPGANPIDTSFFAEHRPARAKITAFGMTRRPGRSASNDPGLAAVLDAQGRRHLLCRQVVGLSRARRARDDRGGKPRLDPRQRARRQGQGPRGAARLRAFLRRLQGQSGLRARLRQGGLRRRRALGGALRHQRRHAAARGGEDRRRGLQTHSRRSCRHPCAQRHRAGGGELVCRRARRRASDSGHAQRARRALRQRQSRLHHPDAEAESRIRARNSISAFPTRRSATSRASRTRSTTSSIAPPTATRPMSARARSPPRPAFMPPPSSRIRRPTSMSRPSRSATSASFSYPINRAARICWPSSTASALPSTRTIRGCRASSTK